MNHILNWYSRQLPEADFHRVGLIAFILLFHTCIVVPATLLTIVMNGSSTIDFAIMCVLGFTILASLLGDLPAKITIPVFLVSTLVHVLIIITYFF